MAEYHLDGKTLDVPDRPWLLPRRLPAVWSLVGVWAAYAVWWPEESDVQEEINADPPVDREEW